VQDVVPVLDHVSSALPPEVIVVGLAVSVTVGAAAVVLTVTVAVALLVGSATEITFTVTAAGDGTDAGAVYKPAPEIVPLVALPPVTPFTCQMVPLFCESFKSVGLNCCVCPIFTVALAGVTDTVTAGVTVIVAAAVFVPSATEVAVKFTAFGEGAFAGAAYVTEVAVTFDSVPHVPPLQPFPERLQVTPLFCASFVRLAVKFCAPMPACTLAVAGESTTEMEGAVSVTVAVAVFAVFACAIAVIVTIALLGITEGAVYMPDAEIVP
jgi:hypothetical protein